MLRASCSQFGVASMLLIKAAGLVASSPADAIAGIKVWEARIVCPADIFLT